uniref:Secreted protein n=1 Tax=Echeneis naucrates TaxID=173247 RepID=A0A665UH48_ECHNA
MILSVVYLLLFAQKPLLTNLVKTKNTFLFFFSSYKPELGQGPRLPMPTTLCVGAQEVPTPESHCTHMAHCNPQRSRGGNSKHHWRQSPATRTQKSPST